MLRRILAALLLCSSTAFAQTTITVDGFDYSVPDHPRVFLDGPTGPISVRLKDPDGLGAQRAPRAIDGDPAYEALKTRLTSCILEGAPYSNCAGYESVTLGAIWWYMDNTQVGALAMVKYKLSVAENFFNAAQGASIQNQLGCDVRTDYCGLQDYSHWASYAILYLSQAYSIVRSEMTEGERLAFTRKMLNDVDVNVGEGGCDDQLQKVVGAAITSYTSGATTLAGTGMDSITPGATLYFKPATATAVGGWAIVSVVTATQLTLASSIKQYSGGNFPSMTGGIIYELGAITDTTCGAVWQAGNHRSNHAWTFGRLYRTAQTEPIDTTETDITVADASGFPTPPFLVAHDGNEYMRVTAVNGNALTVTRNWPNLTGAGIARTSGNIRYNKMLPMGAAEGDPRNNRILLKAAGALAAGLAGLDDLPTEAENFIDQSGWFAKDYMIPAVRADWTGFTQGGSYYSYTINTPFALSIVDMLRKFTGTPGAPSLDYTGDGWPARFAYGLIYNGLPAALTTPISWGTEGMADGRSYFWTPFIVGFAPTSDASKHLQYWLTTGTGTYDAGILAGSTYKPYLTFSLIHMPTTLDPVDYRSVLPTHRAFNVVDTPPGQPWGTYISRTGFSSTADTVLWVNTQQPHPGQADHMLSGAPASYRIYKNGYMLTEQGADNIAAGTSTNMMLIGGAANLKTYSAEWQEVLNDRNDGAATWAYTRVNSVNAYTPTAAASRVLRHIIHFKAGSPDFTVIYDDVASTSGKAKQVNLYHDEGCTTYSWAAPTATCRTASRSMFSTLIYPTGTDYFAATSTFTYGKRVAVCMSLDGTTCDATNTAGEMLVVHQTNTGSGDSMVTTAALATIDSDFRGVEMGGSYPAVAIFPKVGATHDNSSFTSTHSGTATYVVTGLNAGAYDVVRGGVTTVLDDHAVDSDGVLSFTSVAGAFTVSTGTPPPPSITITTTSLPNHVEDVAGYSQQLAYTGGTPAVTWTLDSGTWCAGITMDADGLVSGTPTTQETCNVVVRITDSLEQTDTQSLSITITAPPPACTITTTSLPSGVRNEAYTSQVLASSSCTAPLSWVVTTGTICTGLVLTEATGGIAGTPTVVQVCPITITLTDDNAEVDAQDLSITINAPPPETLNITTTSPLADCTQFQACQTTFTATGGIPPYTWTKTAGTYCVGNSTLDSASGVLSGNPTTVETCTFTIQVEDDDAVTDTVEVSRTILAIPPGLRVQAMPGSNGVVVKFGTDGLPQEQACDVAVSDLEFNVETGEIIGVVASTVSDSGRSSRVVTLGDLTPEHDHEVLVACGAIASGQAQFRTYEASGGTVSWRYDATPSAHLQALSAAKLTVEADLVPTSPGGPITETDDTCSTGCSITLSLASGGVYNIRHIWKTAGDVVLATTQYAPIVVP